MTSHDNIRELLEQRAESEPTRCCLIDTASDREYDYAQVLAQVRTVADFVAARGVPAGASVAYAMSNGRCCAITLLGLFYGGYRAVAVNLVAGRDIIGYVLAHSGAQLVLTQPEHAPALEQALGCEAYAQTRADMRSAGSDGEHSSALAESCELVIIDDTWLEDRLAESTGTESASERVDRPEIDAHHDALLMYTSGTTGRPKGVVLSHGNLLAGGRNVVLGHALTAEDRALCVLPLYHINGLCVTLFAPLCSAGSVVMPPRFSTSGFWQWIDTYRCTWFSVVPTQIAYLLRDAEASVVRPFLRFGRSASAPLSPDMHENFESHFGVPLIETMGLTETAAQISSNPMPPATRKLGSPGQAVGNELRIVGPDLQELPRGQEGELLIRGDNVMQRYFRNPAATEESLVQDGWFRSGDLARMDEAGFLFITGRLKELIIKGGENIAPREIDDALYQHADVVEAAAFARPCVDFGQRIEAAVCLKQSSLLDEAQLLSLCRDRVGAFKCPDRIHFMQELPKGPSGKIQRKKLMELFDQPA